MPIAAVPKYLGGDFSDASPGMRFGTYLPIWTTRDDQEREINQRASKKSREAQELSDYLGRHGMDAAIKEWRKRRSNPIPGLWDKNDHAARSSWDQVKQLSTRDRKQMAVLASRQQSLAVPLEQTGQLLALDAISIAPFATGLGNEHPLENGFSFLNPYGLPYLPGSGVKGVLRQAARELASGDWGDQQGWSENAITALFGREGQDGDTEHQRGAVAFWDVIPQIKGDHLEVEIMTPHQKHYYQDGESPHESGQPNPISFLTVPPGSGFLFHVQCDLPFLKLLARELAENDKWKDLLKVAFEHAFDWCGFGAKTAVGYGAMEIDRERQQEKADRQAKQAEQERLEALSPVERFIAETIEKNRDNNPGALLFNSVEAGKWEDPEDRKLVAERIKALWEEENRWSPEFSGTNKKKVQQKSKCLSVIQWLGG